MCSSDLRRIDGDGDGFGTAEGSAGKQGWASIRNFGEETGREQVSAGRRGGLLILDQARGKQPRRREQVSGAVATNSGAVATGGRRGQFCHEPPGSLKFICKLVQQHFMDLIEALKQFYKFWKISCNFPLTGRSSTKSCAPKYNVLIIICS